MTIDKIKQSVRDKIKQFITKDFHPCLMAISVFNADNANIHSYTDISSLASQSKLLTDLANYKSEVDLLSDKQFASFIAVFPNDEMASESAFEKALWQLLHDLHELDEHPWDTSVSDDVSSEKFSYSLLGTSFYIIGMHPASSRKARRSPNTTIVFNLHSQFEQLRSMGAYHVVRDKIRKRDLKHNGSINPMLADYGSSSEALQYSGVQRSKQWKCPFSFVKSKLTGSIL